jgi:hypothetical protein
MMPGIEAERPITNQTKETPTQDMIIPEVQEAITDRIEHGLLLKHQKRD